jgi:hypothetical protein
VPVLPFALKEQIGLSEHHIQHWASAWLAVYGASILLGSRTLYYHVHESKHHISIHDGY